MTNNDWICIYFSLPSIYMQIFLVNFYLSKVFPFFLYFCCACCKFKHFVSFLFKNRFPPFFDLDFFFVYKIQKKENNFPKKSSMLVTDLHTKANTRYFQYCIRDVNFRESFSLWVIFSEIINICNIKYIVSFLMKLIMNTSIILIQCYHIHFINYLLRYAWES